MKIKNVFSKLTLNIPHTHKKNNSIYRKIWNKAHGKMSLATLVMILLTSFWTSFSYAKELTAPPQPLWTVNGFTLSTHAPASPIVTPEMAQREQESGLKPDAAREFVHKDDNQGDIYRHDPDEMQNVTE